MSQPPTVLRDCYDNGLLFYCPGCKGAHRIQHGAGTGPRWGWNGSREKPTFTPSVLVTGRDFTDKGESQYEAWVASGCPKSGSGTKLEFESVPVVCHTFVTDGRIQFLGDCTHALAGQTVDLPAWPEYVDP